MRTSRFKKGSKKKEGKGTWRENKKKGQRDQLSKVQQRLVTLMPMSGLKVH